MGLSRQPLSTKEPQVKLHPNAKTTPYARALLVERIRCLRWSVDDAAQATGVSRRTAYRWLARERSEGSAGLRDRSCRAHRIPHRTSRLRTERIERLRRGRRTAAQIAARLAMPRSTVAAVLKRGGLERLSRLTPKPAVVRYERQRPGELLHLDTKKLGRFRRAGHRVGARGRVHRSRRAGWEFLHVCVDDHSRLAYVETLPDECAATSIAFLRRAVRWLRQQGIRAQRVMTDNGSGYIAKDFAATCHELGLRHLRTRPYTPRTNGKAERFIQTLLREWAYARPYRTSNQRARRLQPWLRYYNRMRPHSALRGLPPHSRIRKPQ
jgi:transposase InsO family protein